MNKTQGYDVVVEYLQRYDAIETYLPNLTMAKLIYKENVALFKDVEAVRSVVRKLRGAKGDRDRRYADKRLAEVHQKFCSLNPFDDMPEGITDMEEWKPYNIECEKALILVDVHVPYHNKKALIVALEYGIKEGVDTIILNGDFIDDYTHSWFDRDPRRRFLDELHTSVEVLFLIRKAFPSAQIIFKKGNHEERYDRWMKVKAPELLGIAEYDFSTIFKFEDLDIDLVKDRQIMKIGALSIVHGHEFGRSITNPVNPARGLYLRAKEHCICGHFHQTSQHSENTINDEFKSTWSSGCLSDLHPFYLPLNKWNLGFMVVHKYNKKEFEVFNKKIIHNKVYGG